MSKDKITKRKEVHTVQRNNEVIRKGYFKKSHYELIAKLKVEPDTQGSLSLLMNTVANAIHYCF